MSPVDASFIFPLLAIKNPAAVCFLGISLIV
jgi:hypothetical protein